MFQIQDICGGNAEVPSHNGEYSNQLESKKPKSFTGKIDVDSCFVFQ